jgi:molybdopterin synthase sulfur carrier subunit
MPSVVILLPSMLQAKAGNRTSLNVAGNTLREIIEALEQAVPGMQFHLCDESGELRPYVNIFLGQENIRYLEGLETPVLAGVPIRIFPSVAGG